MTAPTTTVLRAVDDQRVEYDRADERYLLNRRPLTVGETDDLTCLLGAGLAYLLPHRLGQRYTPVDTTQVGRGVMSR